jgi:1-acyl-sn-glycerol-3-phosphate acyltransferase
MTTLLTIAALWLAVVFLGWTIVWLLRWRSPMTNDAHVAAVYFLNVLYIRFWHRCRWIHHVPLPRDNNHGGLIVVANHTGAVDPLLIQARCRFRIRWMMASEMMVPALHWLWQREEMIPVDRDGRDMASLREAIRHVKGGGCIGVFPEGRITSPPRQIRPFLPGVGTLIRRTGAPVLVCWIRDTPDTTDMMTSLTSRSHSRVEFLDLVQYDRAQGVMDIATDLRRRIHEASDWPYNNVVQPPGGEGSGRSNPRTVTRLGTMSA